MKKRIHIFILFFLLIVPLGAPSLAEDDSFPFKVAVLAFDDSSIQNRWWDNKWDVGKGVADMFITQLLNTKKFRVIEREQLDSVLKEQRIAVSGLVDSKTAAELGRILGVKYLIIGKITEFSNDSNSADFTDRNMMGLAIKTTTARVSIDVRLVETSTAEIKVSATGNGEKKNTNLGLTTSAGNMTFGSDNFLHTNIGEAMRTAIKSAVTQLAEKAYEGVTITAQIVFIDNEKIYIDVGTDKGVQKGMSFEAVHVLQAILHPDTKEVLDRITETVAELIVTEVRPKVSICTVVFKNGNLAVKDEVILKAGFSPTPTSTPAPTKTLGAKKREETKPKPTEPPDNDNKGAKKLVDWK